MINKENRIRENQYEKMRKEFASNEKVLQNIGKQFEQVQNQVLSKETSIQYMRDNFNLAEVLNENQLIKLKELVDYNKQTNESI